MNIKPIVAIGAVVAVAMLVLKKSEDKRREALYLLQKAEDKQAKTKELLEETKEHLCATEALRDEVKKLLNEAGELEEIDE